MQYQDNIEPKNNEIPRDELSEQQLIGGLFICNEHWDVIAHLVDKSDFFYKRNALVFEAISQLADRGEPFDLPTVSAQLSKNGTLEECGGREYLTQLAETAPSAINTASYAKIVREESVKRRILTTCNEISQAVYEPQGRDSRELLDEAEMRVLQIGETYSSDDEGLVPINKVVAETLNYLETLAEVKNGITGIPSGFKSLDAVTSGFQPGDLIIVGGRPSMGKTAFSMNIAANIAQSMPVAVFSLEMPARSLCLRLMSSTGSIPHEVLRRGEHLQHMDLLRSVLVGIHRMQLFIDDSSSLSITGLRTRARRLKKEVGELGLIVVDYLQLMELPEDRNGSTATQVGKLSRGLKLLAKELNVPIIALSQLNRSVENRTDKRPKMSDIRESGSIEQDADLIMFVYRDIVYNPSADANAAEIIIAKQRNGAIGTVNLYFQAANSRFADLEDVRRTHYDDEDMP
ncbi:MAG: replicative DNA helicase [Cardiobacteriaceae bacterium]|nr:replicative DNA helicase [Cardiobacteriaceae bacterium]